MSTYDNVVKLKKMVTLGIGEDKNIALVLALSKTQCTYYGRLALRAHIRKESMRHTLEVTETMIRLLCTDTNKAHCKT